MKSNSIYDGSNFFYDYREYFSGHTPLPSYLLRSSPLNSSFGLNNSDTTKNIKQVIFNEPATIVFWDDGSKTVVKAQNGEPFDKEKGLAMCIVKKMCGNKGNYYNVFKRWCNK